MVVALRLVWVVCVVYGWSRLVTVAMLVRAVFLVGAVLIRAVFLVGAVLVRAALLIAVLVRDVLVCINVLGSVAVDWVLMVWNLWNLCDLWNLRKLGLRLFHRILSLCFFRLADEKKNPVAS